jgi:glycosyltransferase involved in cell wall biosynthesis
VADTPAEFASAIVSVLEDPELYFRFNCGPEFVRRNFSWREKLDKLELLLQRAASPHLRIEQEALDRAEAF